MARYVVKADGEVKLETSSRAKAEKLYETLVNRKNPPDEVELIYPPYEEGE